MLPFVLQPAAPALDGLHHPVIDNLAFGISLVNIGGHISAHLS